MRGDDEINNGWRNKGRRSDGGSKQEGYDCNQDDQDVVCYCGITEVDISVKIVCFILIHGIGVWGKHV